MPQFHVLRCGVCETFQVLQVTKTNKWKCKMCGRSQSIVKVFGTGSGADCRRHVQKLNRLRGENDQAKETYQLLLTNSPGAGRIYTDPGSYNDFGISIDKQKNSHWSSYIELPNEESEEMKDSGSAFSENRLGTGAVQFTTDWKEYQENRRGPKRSANVRKMNSYQKLGDELDTDPDEEFELEKNHNTAHSQTLRRENGVFGKKDFVQEKSVNSLGFWSVSSNRTPVSNRFCLYGEFNRNNNPNKSGFIHSLQVSQHKKPATSLPDKSLRGICRENSSKGKQQDDFAPEGSTTSDLCSWENLESCSKSSHQVSASSKWGQFLEEEDHGGDNDELGVDENVLSSTSFNLDDAGRAVFTETVRYTSNNETMQIQGTSDSSHLLTRAGNKVEHQETCANKFMDSHKEQTLEVMTVGDAKIVHRIMATKITDTEDQLQKVTLETGALFDLGFDVDTDDSFDL